MTHAHAPQSRGADCARPLSQPRRNGDARPVQPSPHQPRQLVHDAGHGRHIPWSDVKALINWLGWPVGTKLTFTSKSTNFVSIDDIPGAPGYEFCRKGSTEASEGYCGV